MNEPEPTGANDIDIEALIKSDEPYLSCKFFGEPDSRDVCDAEVEAPDDPGDEWGV